MSRPRMMKGLPVTAEMAAEIHRTVDQILAVGVRARWSITVQTKDGAIVDVTSGNDRLHLARGPFFTAHPGQR